MPSKKAAASFRVLHPCKKSTAGPTDQKNELLNEIQYKKEELFNMIAKVDKLPSRYTRDNVHLLMYLSEQIQLHNDPEWYNNIKYAKSFLFSIFGISL
jgi:hypothetical protein